MFPRAFVLLLLVAFNAGSPLGRDDERFHEELVVRPLSGDHVNTYFQFTTRWHYGEKDNREFPRFPIIAFQWAGIACRYY